MASLLSVLNPPYSLLLVESVYKYTMDDSRE